MSAVLEAPLRKPRRRTPGTWTAEQAHAANLKSRIAKRTKAEQRKLAKLNKAPEPKPTSPPDPLHALTHALAVAAKRNQGKLAVNLATALAKLKQAHPIPSASNTPTACSPVRQPTPSIPQVSQAVHTQVEPAQPNYAQYADHLKESISSETVVAGRGVGTGQGAGVGGVIEPITRTPNSGPSLVEATVEQLEARLKELRSVSNPVSVRCGLVGPVPSSGPGSIGVKPQEGMEKFMVGGVWVYGKRNK